MRDRHRDHCASASVDSRLTGSLRPVCCEKEERKVSELQGKEERETIALKKVDERQVIGERRGLKRATVCACVCVSVCVCV